MDPAILRQTEFPAADRARWTAKLTETLGGEQAIARTDDGIAIEPLAASGRDVAPLPRARPAEPWRIVQRIDDTDPKRANAQAREDREQGATGFSIVLAGAPNAFGHGLPATVEAVRTVFEGVALDDLLLRVDVHPHRRASIDQVAAFMKDLGADPSQITLSLGVDPSAVFASTGHLRMSIDALEASLPQSLAGFFAVDMPGVLLEADGRPFHNAGASEAQELGIMLATAASHLRMFEEARQPLIYAAPHIGFALSVDQDQFLSTAKLRALRKLWARVLEACQVPPMAAVVHAETSYRMMTLKDPETNILRSTIAAFAAVTGGADSLSVLPHTIAHGLPDGFARRLARNTQMLLADESHIGFVSDPAAGAAGIEALTDALCEKAWEEFQRIEAEGGTLRSLAAGQIQKRIAEMAARRRQAFRNGERPIVGTSLYPADKERPVHTLSTGPADFDIGGVVSCAPLSPMRNDQWEEASA